MWQLGDAIPGFGSATTGHNATGTFDTYTVTSGANGGAGTLREFVENRTGPRLIKFASDTRDIQLTADLIVTDGNLTINGVSAGGVQIRNWPVKIRADNVLLYGLMPRPGDEGGGTQTELDARDGLVVGTGGANVSDVAVIHCSFEWAIDENLNIFQGSTDWTFYRCIFAEGLYNSLHSNGIHSMGALTSGSTEQPVRGSFIECGFFFNNRRNPRIADGDHIEIANCFSYGGGNFSSSIHFPTGADQNIGEAAVLYNHYEQGAGSGEKDGAAFIGDEKGTIYVVGNRCSDVNGDLITGNHWKGNGATIVQSVPAWATGDYVASSANVRATVLANAGAYPPARDEADARIINQVTNRTGSFVDTIGSTVAGNGQWPTLPDYEPSQITRLGRSSPALRSVLGRTKRWRRISR